MSNRLANESSPYLLQHAENPVDWYPWGPEALDRARDDDLPILLSVGYSACHWCHVMERESFEDPAIAARMNRSFVNIKVDREERPDLDQIYMKAVQAMSGRGGWPMTVFLTPGRVPFFGGTYYPPEPRPGMPSFPQILDAVAEAWHERRDEVVAGSARLLDALRRATKAGSDAQAGVEILERARQTLGNQYDATHGGFGQAPKFPQPVTLEFLMRDYLRSGRAAALEMPVHTLRRMAAGGMRDHLGGGFHRYSVDARWLVPHFEKMLYDNALLASTYLDAYRLTDSDDLLDVAVDTLEYILADLRSPRGGFFSARDADSEGEEGRFYVWSRKEVEGVLGAEEGRLFSRAYDVSEAGNFEGANILHLPHDLTAVAAVAALAEGDLERRLEGSRRKLLARRATREPPFRDEKVIVSWNGLAIRALADAGALTGRGDFLHAAREAATFILEEMRSTEGDLLHTSIAGEARIPAFLDDYASLGNGLLTLHGATLERRWLDAAMDLCEVVLDRFWDDEEGTVFDTATGTEALIVRPRDPMDSATPSGPSLAAELLARAGRIADHARWLDAARRIVHHEADALLRFGPAFGRMLSVLDRLESDSVEIAVFGGDDAETRALVRAVHAEFLPGAVVVGRLDHEIDSGPSPLLEGRGRIDGRAAVYVCRDHACELPVTEPAGVAARLRELASTGAEGANRS